MKKFFKGIWNLIKRHKLLSAICLLAFTIIIVMMYVFFSLFIGGTDKYGDRLKGIESHTISKNEQKDAANFLKEKEEVTDASVRIQGKIIYIHIQYKREISLDRAKEIAAEVLTKFEDDDKKFYDIGYSLTQDPVEDKNDKGFMITGTKNNDNENISWIKS